MKYAKIRVASFLTVRREQNVFVTELRRFDSHKSTLEYRSGFVAWYTRSGWLSSSPPPLLFLSVVCITRNCHWKWPRTVIIEISRGHTDMTLFRSAVTRENGNSFGRNTFINGSSSSFESAISPRSDHYHGLSRGCGGFRMTTAVCRRRGFYGLINETRGESFNRPNQLPFLPAKS